MKNIIISNVLALLVALFLLPTISNAQTTTKTSEDVICTTTHQSELNIFVPENVQIVTKSCKGTRIIVETSISIEGSIKAILVDYLVSQGRYSLRKEYNDNSITLSLKDLQPIATKTEGTTNILYEKITYTIYIPSHLAKVTINEAF